jgi:transcriptional regulator with XRE-family HTH domain
MSGMMPAPGPVGRNLIANVEYLRRKLGLSLNKLSAELDKAGRPIPPLGLARTAKGERRIDVDELVALAAVLDVTPDVLLSPPEAVKRNPAEVPAVLREARNLVRRVEGLLGAADDPEARGTAGAYVDRALRRVQIEVEELLAETARPDARRQE